MIKVYNKSTNELLGRISKDDLNFLAERLEEEGRADSDYYLRSDTVAEFEKQGASPKLIEILRSGFRGKDSMEIRWEQDNLPIQ